MIIGWATPTVEPLAGANLGGPNGAVLVNGVGSCPAAGPATTGTASGSGAGGNPGTGGATTPGSPGAGAGSGSASAGPALSTSTQPNIEATPAAFRAANRLPLVQPDIYIPPVTFGKQCRIAPKPAIYSFDEDDDDPFDPTEFIDEDEQLDISSDYARRNLTDEVLFGHIAPPADATRTTGCWRDRHDNWTRGFHGTQRAVDDVSGTVGIFGTQSSNGRVTTRHIRVHTIVAFDAAGARRLAAAILDAADELDELQAEHPRPPRTTLNPIEIRWH